MKSVYDYETEIDELLDDALNNLTPAEYSHLLDDISIILAERD